MRFSGFFVVVVVVILSLTVKPTIKIIDIISLSVGKCTKSAGDQIIFPPLYSHYI